MRIVFLVACLFVLTKNQAQPPLEFSNEFIYFKLHAAHKKADVDGEVAYSSKKTTISLLENHDLNSVSELVVLLPLQLDDAMQMTSWIDTIGGWPVQRYNIKAADAEVPYSEYFLYSNPENIHLLMFANDMKDSAIASKEYQIIRNSFRFKLTEMKADGFSIKLPVAWKLNSSNNLTKIVTHIGESGDNLKNLEITVVKSNKKEDVLKNSSIASMKETGFSDIKESVLKVNGKRILKVTGIKKKEGFYDTKMINYMVIGADGKILWFVYQLGQDGKRPLFEAAFEKALNTLQLQ